MAAPLVSILLPVRNGGALLDRAIASTLAEPMGDFELLAIDDNSTDDTAARLARWATIDRRLRVFAASPPGGLVAALRTGWAAARAPCWIARMDADDVWRPRLHAQLARLSADPTLAAVGGRVAIVGNPRDPTAAPDAGFARYQEWTNRLLEPEAIARERFIESPLVHPSVLMRRAAVEAVGGYRDAGWAEDYDLWLRLLNAGWRLAKVPEVVLEWQDGPTRLTRTDGAYGAMAMMAARAHWMACLPAVRARGVMISGAGPIGKSLARLLRAEGITVHAFLDLSPRRIGTRIDSIPVRAAGDLAPASSVSPVQVGALGQPGRRNALRALMAEAGYVEGVDYWNAG